MQTSLNQSIQKKKRYLSRQSLKSIVLSSLGGALEAYDFLIFVFFISYISPLFFPSYIDPFWRDVSSYAIFSTGYILRPLGGVLLAHFGDKFGRKRIFIVSLILMVFPILVMASLPTFDSIGYAAPILLLVMRMMQGISFGGEIAQAWVFVNEHSSKEREGRYMSIISSATVLGVALGAIVSLIMHKIFTHEELASWAWRVPFFLGAIFGLISLYVRRFMSETPVFKHIRRKEQVYKFPLREVFRLPLILVTIAVLISLLPTGIVLILQLLMPKFMQAPLNITPSESVTIQLYGMFLMIIGNIVAGYLADKFRFEYVCSVFAIGLIVSGYFFFHGVYVSHSLAFSSTAYIVANFFSGVILFTPLYMCRIFDPKMRLSAISLIYNMIYAITGFSTPEIALFLHKHADSNPYGLFYYFAAIIAGSLIASILFARLRAQSRLVSY